MVDIQSATTEIRWGKKERKKQDKNIISASATEGGHKKQRVQTITNSYVLSLMCTFYASNPMYTFSYSHWDNSHSAQTGAYIVTELLQRNVTQRKWFMSR